MLLRKLQKKMQKLCRIREIEIVYRYTIHKLKAEKETKLMGKPQKFSYKGEMLTDTKEDKIQEESGSLTSEIENGMLKAIQTTKPGHRQALIDEYRTFISVINGM